MNQDRLKYHLQPAQGQATGLLVLMHGVGSNLNDLMGIAQYLNPNLTVAYLQGPIVLNPSGGQYAWFNIQITPTKRIIDTAQAQSSLGLLANTVAHLQQSHGFTPQQTIVAGFSQGGIMSASLALTQPNMLAGFGLLSSRILDEIKPQIAPQSALAHLKAFIGHGTADPVMPISYAQQSQQLLQSLGINTTLNTYPMAHTLSLPEINDFSAWVDTVL